MKATIVVLSILVAVLSAVSAILWIHMEQQSRYELVTTYVKAGAYSLPLHIRFDRRTGEARAIGEQTAIKKLTGDSDPITTAPAANPNDSEFRQLASDPVGDYFAKARAAGTLDDAIAKVYARGGITNATEREAKAAILQMLDHRE
jgi:hypothetical protein